MRVSRRKHIRASMATAEPPATVEATTAGLPTTVEATTAEPEPTTTERWSPVEDIMRETLDAAARRLGWASLRYLQDVLDGDQPVLDDDDEPCGMHVFRDGEGFAGGCDYGSSIDWHPDAGWWRVESCGGHLVAWSIFAGWDCDFFASVRSWADDSDTEHLDREEIINLRVKRLTEMVLGRAGGGAE